MHGSSTEQLLPVLSPGRHHNPRRGACFMEYASYLAGLRWSDHPPCTHASIAGLARLVNDVTSDSARSRLVVLIPRVVGLTGPDHRVPLVVASLAASAAIVVSSEPRQRALAAALLRCERLLMAEPDADTADSVIGRTRVSVREALDAVPGAETWARTFEGRDAVSKPRPFVAGDEAVSRVAVIGVAEACISHADELLVDLLTTVISECEQLLRPVVEDERMTPATSTSRKPAVARR